MNMAKPGAIGYISAIEGDKYYVTDHVSRSGDSLRIHHHPSASIFQGLARVGLEVMDVESIVIQRLPNISLQVTFDPPPIFAAAKTVVASNAAELRRYTLRQI